MTFHVYTLSDPRTRAIRYVGCTNNPQARAAKHHKQPSSAALGEWVCELASANLRPVLVVVDRAGSAKEAANLERYWVAEYAALGADLLNSRRASYPASKRRYEHRKRLAGASKACIILNVVVGYSDDRIAKKLRVHRAHVASVRAEYEARAAS